MTTDAGRMPPEVSLLTRIIYTSTDAAHQTPSPHRFLPSRRQTSPTKASKKSSAPRSSRGDGFDDPAVKSVIKANRPVAKPIGTTVGDGFAGATPRPKSSSNQFAQTPRFSSGHSTSPPRATRNALPPRSSLAHALRASITTENVEDLTPSPTTGDDDDDMLVSEHEAVPTTEMLSQHEEWTQDLPHSPKRRKIDDLSAKFQAALDSPARPTIFKHPTTPASALRQAAHQFTRASSVASSVADEGGTVRRPAFLRSSVAPAENFEPLPEAFSPHRRGEKFIPGGMASSLQQWVVEMGQSAAHSRRGQGYLQGEAYLHRVKVESVSGHCPMLIQGRREDGHQLQFLLIAEGKALTGNVCTGSIVGIRAPSWEVELEGDSWIVGVDWRTLG